ncbi:MAG: FHA domain-containing protein [Proteobacteria bacterium]|nr:FHA domain-containing protein [Pseudomonadota bacterium]NOG60491.1 FHA domain-containing protein [Pseudomonadota bacterium]
MLQRFFTHPIEITIHDKAVMFNSVEDFEFALEARTAIPLDKITSAIKSSVHDLQQEAEAIAVAEDKLAHMMSKSPETSDGITMRLKSIDSSIFSKDNGWRDIIIGLNSDDSFESCKYKQVALKTYLRYLSNRLEMIKLIQAELEKQDANKQSISLATAKTGAFEINNEVESTLIDSKSGMTKLPKGKSVILDVKQGDRIEFILAKYKCELLVGEDIKFIDSNGTECLINIGINKVGRGHACSVKFSSELHEISRVHLVIANHNDQKLELTDLSTHGTYFRHIPA